MNTSASLEATTNSQAPVSDKVHPLVTLGIALGSAAVFYGGLFGLYVSFIR
jgi:hypothetical protein